MISFQLNSSTPHMIEMTLQSHELCYCIFFFFLSPGACYSIRCCFTSSSQRKCHASYYFFHETHAVSSSCSEDCVFVARTLHFSPSQPSIHAPTLWHGLFLWRQTFWIKKKKKNQNHPQLHPVFFNLNCFAFYSYLFSVSPSHSYFQRMLAWSPFQALRWWPAALHICSEALGCQRSPEVQATRRR